MKVGASPCGVAAVGTLYIGQDDAPFSSPWLKNRFEDMSSRYAHFYEESLMNVHDRPMWSAGIVVAGDRATLLEFLSRLLAVLVDVQLIKPGKFQGVNMAAVNYVVERYFSGRSVGGEPLHSKYRAYQRERKDVWFIHK